MPSLFALAARATTDKDLADQFDSELVAKRARTIQPVLIGKPTDESHSESKEKEGHLYDIKEKKKDVCTIFAAAANSAMDKILGKGHGLCLAMYTACEDKFCVDETLLLELVESREEVDLDSGPGVMVFSVQQNNRTDISNKESVDASIRRVLDRLGLEAKTDPQWHFCFTHSREWSG